MRHELKTWPEFFQAILDGDKHCEVRFDDRGFKKGDDLLLREWKPETKEYTGRTLNVVVTHILRGLSGLDEDYVVMSIEVVPGDVV